MSDAVNAVHFLKNDLRIDLHTIEGNAPGKVCLRYKKITSRQIHGCRVGAISKPGVK